MGRKTERKREGGKKQGKRKEREEKERERERALQGERCKEKGESITTQFRKENERGEREEKDRLVLNSRGFAEQGHLSR